MPNYRRLRIKGGTYFFTVNLQDRRSDLLVREIDTLRRAVARVRAEFPFQIDAWVVLPDHMHCVWTLPPGDDAYPPRWQKIKIGFSASMAPAARRPQARVARQEHGLWQRRYWEHAVRDARDYAAHIDYTHFNPVKHGLAGAPGDWPYSSFRRAVACGQYPQDWAGSGSEPAECGERRDS